MLIEVCVDSLKSAKAAAQGGADRIELCSALKLGGLTPTIGLLTSVKSSAIVIDVFCMIRCRGGDFVYDDDEMKTMLNDIALLKASGADGFVFGALTPDGQLDRVNCSKVMDACHPMPVTLHRAFDHSTNWRDAVDTAIQLGFHYILTSGQEASVSEGIERLKEIIRYANDRIIIMAGSGVNVKSLPTIKNALPLLKALHTSASIKETSRCSARPSFKLGENDAFDSERATSATLLSEIVAIARSHNDTHGYTS
uniref:Copper homeostasis protein cutC homolog n=2 Tax=Parascaris univalens TaxID=6257 RepID=A0A915AKD1_PARUN